MLRDPVSRAYALNLNETFPSPLSSALVTADLLSAVCRPSRTAYLPVSPKTLASG